MPLIKSGAKAIGKQALKSGVGFASVVTKGKNIKQAAIDCAKAAGSSLLHQAVAPKKMQDTKSTKKVTQKKSRHFRLVMASLVHFSLTESITSQLDLFSVPPTQTRFEDGFYTKYHPVSILSLEGLVEFCIAVETSN